MKKTPVLRCLFHKKNRIATGREGGAALREQSNFAANYCISSKVERNQTIDNRLAGRAAKGERVEPLCVSKAILRRTIVYHRKYNKKRVHRILTTEYIASFRHACCRNDFYFADFENRRVKRLDKIRKKVYNNICKNLLIFRK